MRKERKHFTPEEKVAILRRHLVDKVPVSDLCEELPSARESVYPL
jgi:transposase